MVDEDRIIKVNIEEEMKNSYRDYSMSVIVARALPDVRDGFKPVHRRILYGMMELGVTHDKPTRKSARIVGDVMGKYHPHGDSSIYGALVRLAQDWNMRYPLVFGQGNFGSMDGDSPAAMRYTEARLSRVGEAMMTDLEKETVDMDMNFENRLPEPTVMPTRIPNFLVNGASGIAVGMATNVPTHNLGEVIDGCVALIDNPDITIPELMEYVKAPDFPTGGYIIGMQGVKSAYETGRGRIVMRARTEIETHELHDSIVVTEIPYGVNKAELIRYIAELVNEKKIEGISNVNDESDREQKVRIVIDIKRDANANVVLNKLLKMTQLQTTFAVNCIGLVHGRPRTLTLKDCISTFVEHRRDVVTRRTIFDLRKAKERAHILEGLIIASDNIDEVVHIIRASKNPQAACDALKERFSLDDLQAKAIVDMRLAQLTNIQQDKLHEEYEELQRRIAYYEQILADDKLRDKVIKDELQEVKEKYGDERRTEICLSNEEFNPEDFFADDEVVITISHLGYIKRTPLAEFKAQGRGGVGSKGGATREQDFIEYIYPATVHNTMLFFTAKGRCFWLKVYEIPEGNKNSKGRAIQNMLNIEPGDSINACLHIRKLADAEFCESHYVMFCTKEGIIKKTCLKEYSRPRANGVNAITIREEDRVVSVALTNGTDEIVMANRNGRAIRFNESTVRTMGRTATGGRGMRLDEDGQDEVIGMVAVNNPETGPVVAIKCVTDDDDLMIINKSGVAIRLKLSEVRVMGRATQGVRLINLEKRGDIISSVCQVPTEEEELPEAEEISESPVDSVSAENPESPETQE